MKTANISIRKATKADAEIIADIYNEHITAGFSTMDEILKSESDIINWFNGFNDRELILLLQDEKEVFGWGIIKRYSDRKGYDVACETAVYLRSDKTGQSFGGMMKKALIEKCRQLKYHHLVAKIFSENYASIRYNEKLGYEIVGIQKEIGFKRGKWLDVTIMQLILS